MSKTGLLFLWCQLQQDLAHLVAAPDEQALCEHPCATNSILVVYVSLSPHNLVYCTCAVVVGCAAASALPEAATAECVAAPVDGACSISVQIDIALACGGYYNESRCLKPDELSCSC